MLCLAAASVLVIYGQSSVMVLQVITGLLGFGVSPAFPCTMLWMEENVRVSSKIGLGPTHTQPISLLAQFQGIEFLEVSKIMNDSPP